MALVTDVLQLFGVVHPPPADSSPATRSTLRWPDVATPISAGSVLSTAGGLDRATSPRPRAVCFLAPETTVRGLAGAVRLWLQTITGPPIPVPDELQLARALLAYHRDDLGLPQLIAVTVPNRPFGFSTWQVGRGIRLPIELDGTALISDLAHWNDLAATADPSWDVLIDLPPQPLALPNVDADRTWAAAQLSAQPSAAQLADAVRTALLLNPCESVYRLLALLAETDAGDPAEQTAALTTLIGTALSTDELGLLATTLPGAVVLRAVYRRLAVAFAQTGHDPSVDTTIGALNTALGLAVSGPADLTASTPSVVPRELPTSSGWGRRPIQSRPRSDANGERTDGDHVLVLGRDLFAGPWVTQGAFTGPAYLGTPPYEAGSYVSAHHDEVYPAADPKLTARLDVMAAISPNEGYLDAVRFLDKGIVSPGVQQWTVHVDNELDVLLWNLLQEHPDDYDAHVGIYGLRLSLTSTWPAGTPGMTAGAAQQVALARAVPGSSNVAMVASGDHPDQLPDRLHFFGGAENSPGPGHISYARPTPWAGRLRSAARCSQPYRLLQLLTAANRFDRILAENHSWTVAGQNHPIAELITSTQGAALLLDQHINAPGHVQADVATAIAAVPPSVVATDANGLTTAWLSAFEDRYRVAVRYLSSIQKLDAVVNGTPVRGRQSYVLSLQLKHLPHSFGGW